MAVTLTRRDGTGIITLDTPPANAYTQPMLQELAQAVDEARNDDSVRCVVVDSALDK